MQTLTQTAQLTRKTVKYGILCFVLLIIAITGWQIYKNRPRPKLPPLPTCEFGKLPPLVFPPEKERPNIFTLQTIQAVPPEAPLIEKVYLVPEKGPDILAGRRAQQFARELNFPTRPVEKEPDRYVFVDPEYPARSLIYDPLSGNFQLEFDLTKDSSPLNGDVLPLDENRAIAEAETILQSLGKLHSELVGTKRFVSYLIFEDNNLVEVQNKLQAQFVRVDFMRGLVAEKEIKTPERGKSSIFVIFSGRREEQQRLVKIYYQLFSINSNVFATYPLKSSQAAWEELKSGGGYVVNIGENNQNEAIIRDAYLAYFDPNTTHQFLQPIFVFTGDRDFEAFVAAIPPDACN